MPDVIITPFSGSVDFIKGDPQSLTTYRLDMSAAAGLLLNAAFTSSVGIFAPNLARLSADNTFTGTTTFNGNTIVNGNFSVFGNTTLFSASNVYISSSVLTIEDNILTLNAFSPYLRYAGIEMYDSGSGTLSSLLWDGENDYFFLSGSGVNGKLITGPDGQSNLTSNYVPKATAGYKLGNSIIFDDGTNVGIGSSTPSATLNVAKTSGNFIFDLTNATENAFKLRTYNSGSATAEDKVFVQGLFYNDVQNAAINFHRGSGTTAGFLSFTTNTGIERMRITAQGRVGIGLVDPAYSLHVRDSTNVGTIAIGHPTYPGLIIANASSGEFRIDNRTSAGSGYITFFPNGQDQTLGNEAMRINTSGFVGIGTTAPSSLLHVYNTAARYLTFSPSGLTIQRNVLSTNAASPQLTLINTQGTDFVNRGTSIQFDLGYGGTSTVVGTAARGARIAALSETGYTSTSSDQNAYLAFFTATAGTLTEKLRIRSDGSLSPITVSGTNGVLFNVVDDLSDSLLSVNNAAGLPVFEVFADDRIVAGQYNQNDFVIVNNRIGIGTNNPTAKLHVTSSTSLPSALFLGGNVGISTTNVPTKLTIVGNDNKDTGPILSLSGESLNQFESGRIRFTESNIAGSPFYQGAYVHYDGSNNVFNIGVHGNVDSLTSSDVNAISILRSNAFVGIGTSNPGVILDVQGASGVRIAESGSAYNANLLFGNDQPTWGSGIRVYDNNDAELRIWHRNTRGQIVLATGYNGNLATSLPTDGLFIVGDTTAGPALKVGIGYTAANIRGGSAKLSVNGNISAAGTISEGGYISYGMRVYTVNLSAQSTASFYPIVIDNSPDNNTWHHTFSIEMPSLPGGDPYNNHSMYGEVRGGGWSDQPAFYRVFHSFYDNTERSILGIWRPTQSWFGVVVYVRGGMTYSVRTNSRTVAGYTGPVNPGGNAVFAIKNAAGADVSGSSAFIGELLNLRTAPSGFFHSNNGFFDGYVGIGTTSALSRLDVRGAHTSGYGILNVISTDAALLSLDSTGARDQGLRLKYNGIDKWLVGMRDTNEAFSFSNSADTRLVTLLQGGNLGIGTTNPSKLLHVHGTFGEVLRLSMVNSYTASNGPQLSFYNSTTEELASIRGAFNETAQGNRANLIFGTRTSDALGVQTKMTILHNGNVGIGSATPASKLDIYTSGSINLLKGVTYNNSVNFNNASLEYYDTSTDNQSTTTKVNINAYFNKRGTSLITGYTVGNFFATTQIDSGSVSQIWDYASRVEIRNQATASSIMHFVADAGYVTAQGGVLGKATDRTGLYVRSQNQSAQTLTNQYGIYIEDLGGSTNNYGVYSAINSASNKYNFYAAGSANNYFAGNVGIATTNPVGKLDVRPDSSWLGSEAFIVDTDGSNNPRIRLYRPDGASPSSSYAIHIRNDSGNLNILTSAATTLGSETATSKFYFTTGGNLGIGTTSPLTRLHLTNVSVNPAGGAIGGDSKLVISGVDGTMDLLSQDDNSTVSNVIGMGRYHATTGALIHKFGIVTWANTGAAGSNTGDRFGFHYGTNADSYASTELLTIKSGGNVGIGTISPAAKLHVMGDISASGQIKAPSFFSNGGAGSNYFETINIGTGVYIEGGANEGIYFGDGNRWIIDTCNAAHNDNADGELHFRDYTNSVTRMLIQYSTGNVGIGTTVPNAKLHVNSNGSLPAGSVVFRVEGTSGSLFSVDDTLNGSLMSVNDVTGLPILEVFSDDRVVMGTFNANTLVVTGSRVGVGTSTPTGSLHVQNTVANIPILNLGGGIAANNVSDLYVLNSYNTGSGVGYAAKVIGINISGSLTAGNIPIQRTVWSGVTSATAIVLSSDDPGILGQDRAFQIWTSNDGVAGTALTQKFTMTSAGDVGIGTTNPAYKLDVIGGIRYSGAISNVQGNLNSLRGVVSTMGYNLTGSPNSTAGWVTVNTYQNSLFTSDILSQIAYDNYVSEKMFTRYSADAGATWSSWKTIINSDALSGTSNYIPKFTGTNSIGNSAIIDVSGNIGIGLTNPQRILDVLSDANNFITVGARTLSVGDWTGIHFGYRENNNSYRKSAIVFQRTDLLSSNAQGKIHILNGPQVGSGNATLADARLTIGESGNVGIGSTAPTGSLDVAGIVRTQFIEGLNEYAFRGADKAVNDWETSGAITGPTVNSYNDGSWYIDTTTNGWGKGIQSRRRFRRVEGLTFEYEAYAQDTIGGGVYVMHGFVGGDSGAPTHCQTPADLIYQQNNSILAYTNCVNSGSNISFDTRDNWWRFKTVLKSTGASHYIYKDGKWNTIAETTVNNQSNHEWVRVMVDLYRNRIFFRDMKVYVAQQYYRGSNYIDNIAGRLIANGSVSAGVGGKLSFIGLDINTGVTPTYIKIVTTIPSVSPTADFTVNIKGFSYGSQNAVDISICWHWYTNTFYNATAKSSGGWAPTIRLSAENGFVAIVLTSGVYWSKLYVESLYSSNYNNQYVTGWSWLDEDATGNPIVTLAYRSHFGNNFIMYGDGTVTVKGTDNNSGKADLSVDSGGTATMALSGQYFRVGSTDVNWNVKIQSDGYFATWAQSMRFSTDSGANPITFATDGTERMRISGTGLVGIGTTSPTSLLHAYSSDGRFFTYSGTTGAFTIQRNVLSTGAATPQLTLINTQGTDFVNRGTSIQFDLGYGGSSSTVGTSARGARIAALSETGYSATAANQNAYLAFSTATAGVLTEKLRIRSDGSLSPITVSGTNGVLFNVVDDLSDSLLSVNNAAGLPVFEVFADDRIVGGQYNQNDFVVINNRVGIGTNNPTAKLTVTSSVSISSAEFLGGKVGIGTINPAYRLDVFDTAVDVARVYNNLSSFNFRLGSTSNTDYTNLLWFTSNGNAQFFKNRVSTSWGGQDSMNLYNSNGGFAFHPNGVANKVLITTGGNLEVAGSITGSSFSGAGTGLTGTAASLTVGNATSATSATSATYAGYVTSLGSNLNYEPYSGSRVSLFKASGLTHYSGYSSGTNRPTTFDYTLQVTDGGKGWEISMDWISLAGPAIYARSARDCCQGWSQWVRILDSVNYAFAANMNQNVRTSDNVTFGTVTAALNGSCTGTAASETLATVSGRGNATQTRLIVSTAAGQPMFVGRQAGAGYSYGSAGIFTAISDNPNGANNIFFQGYNSGSSDVPGGILAYSVRADGQIYTTMNTATGIANNSFSVGKALTGTIHIANGNGTDGNNRQAAITFQGDSASQSQAGIYVSNNNSSGTAMAFATTDNYTTGPQIFMSASNVGVVNFSRARPTYAGNTIIDTAYSGTVSGLSIGGTAATATTANSLNASNQYSVAGITGSVQTVAVRETYVAVTAFATTTINLSSGTVFNLAFGTSITQFNINGVDTGKVNSFTLITAPNGTAATISWSFSTNGGAAANVKWPGTAPTATTTNNRWDVFSFVYNGSAWYGFTGGLNYV